LENEAVYQRDVEKSQRDAAAVGAAVGAAGTGVAVGTSVATGVVGSLLTAAGVSATALPVIGWVAGGVMALTAGTIATVRLVRQKKANNAEMVKLAQQMGLPNADEAPAFTAKAMKLPDAEITKLMDNYAKRVRRMEKDKGLAQAARSVGRWFAPGRAGSEAKEIANLKSRLGLLGAVHLLHQAELRGKETPEAMGRVQVPDVNLSPASRTFGVDNTTLVVGGAVLVGVAVIAAVAIRKSRTRG
jgi:hypothetical protein